MISRGVTILVCPCGQRLRAAGTAPGRLGRCPCCGRTLRIFEGASAPPSEAVSDDDVSEMLRQEPDVAPARPAPAPVADEDEWAWRGTYDLRPAPPTRPLDRASVGRPLGPGPGESAPAPPAEAEQRGGPSHHGCRGASLGSDGVCERWTTIRGDP